MIPSLPSGYIRQLMVGVIACVLTSASQAHSQTHLGMRQGQVHLQELVIFGNEVVERPSTISAQRHPDEPVLLLYVPATRTARQCVLEVITPIKEEGENLTPIRVVNILDVSRLNFLLEWIVTNYYERDFRNTANTRARFFLDRTGVTRQQWRLNGEDCSYSLFHPKHPPISSSGLPSVRFIKQLKINLLSLRSTWNDE